MDCLTSLLITLSGLMVLTLIGLWWAARWLLLREVNAGPVATGREGMVGLVGVVTRQIDGAAEPQRGQVRVRGELWSAAGSADSPRPLAAGREVEVVEIDGLTVVVRPHERS